MKDKNMSAQGKQNDIRNHRSFLPYFFYICNAISKYICILFNALIDTFPYII